MNITPATQAWKYATRQLVRSGSSGHLKLLMKIAGLVQGGSVLDIGCGEALVLDCLAKTTTVSHYTGIDFRREAIEVAKLLHANTPINTSFYAIHVERLGPDLGQFDNILAIETLEHLVTPALEALKHLPSMLAPHGQIIISVPTPGSPMDLRHRGDGDGITITDHVLRDYIPDISFVSSELPPWTLYVGRKQ